MSTTRLVALVRIFGRESCRDPRFVDWLVRAGGRDGERRLKQHEGSPATGDSPTACHAKG